MAEKGKEIAPRDQIYDLLAAHKQSIVRVLPKHVTPERIMRIAHQEITSGGRLRECTHVSLLNGVIEISVLGLEIGRTAYLVPFKNKHSGRYEATVIIDYRGFIELGFRSGMVSSWPFKPVYAADEFQVSEGTHREIRHFPKLDGDRGQLVAAYSVVNFNGGGFDFEVVGLEDVAVVKKRSASFRRGDGPWADEDDEWTMWCKTAVRRLSKRVPQSPELQRAVVLDEMAEAGLRQKLDYIKDLIDITPGTEKAPKDLYKSNGQIGAPEPAGASEKDKRPDADPDPEQEKIEDKDHPWFPLKWKNLRKSKHGGTGYAWYISEHADSWDTAKELWKKQAIDKFHGMYPGEEFPIRPNGEPATAQPDDPEKHFQPRHTGRHDEHDAGLAPGEARCPECDTIYLDGETHNCGGTRGIGPHEDVEESILNGFTVKMPDDADGFAVMQISGMVQEARRQFPELCAFTIEKCSISPDDITAMRVPSERWAASWEFLSHLESIADEKGVNILSIKTRKNGIKF